MTEFLVGVLVGALVGATPMAILARIAREHANARSVQFPAGFDLKRGEMTTKPVVVPVEGR